MSNNLALPHNKSNTDMVIERNLAIQVKKAMLAGIASYHDHLSNKRAVLPISVGQPAHEKDKLKVTLQLVAKRFGYCDIVLADTLQRYNLLDRYTQTEALIKSNAEGDEWLKRNQVYLKNFTIPHKIIKWNECIQWSTFEEWLNIIKIHFQNNQNYQLSFQHDIDLFLKRQLNTQIAYTTIVENSRAYLFEETAVVLSYFIDNQYHYILYPSAIPKSISMSRSLFVENKYPELIRHLKIYFR